jgi:hypothetical protein
MAENIIGSGNSPFYSYDLAVETKINIDELIYTLSPLDLPLLTGVGGTGNPIIPRSPVDTTTFYWLEDEVPLPTGTLLTALTTVATTVVLQTTQGYRFHIGDAIRILGETMFITGVNADATSLTVTRAAAGSTLASATIPTGTEVVGVGTVLAEGSLGLSNYTGRTKYSNVTQIFSSTVQVSRTEQRIPKYGVPNELNRQMANSMHSVWQTVEQAAVYGQKFENTGSRLRQTGGLDNFITTNIDSTNTWITLARLEAMQQLAFNRGGMFTTLIGKPQIFGALNNLSGSERISTVTIDDARRGRSTARTVMTEFGEVELYRSRWIRNNEAYCYNPENFIMRQFQPMVTERLAKTDDTDKYMMVTECGFEVKGQAHMGKFTALDQTANLPTALV